MEQPVEQQPDDRLAALEKRVAELESQAHTSHTIEPETLDQIAAHVVNRLNDHLRAFLGHKPKAE